MVDKNNPPTWRPFKPRLCQECQATCCTMPLEVTAMDLLRLGLLSEDEGADLTSKTRRRVAKRLQKAGVVRTYRESTGLFLLEERPSGDCQFLNANRKCSVYERRPEVCRQFPTQKGPRWGYCPFIKRSPSD